MGSFRRFPGSWRRLGDVPADRTHAAIAEVLRTLRTIAGVSVGSAPCRFVWEDDGSMLVMRKFPTSVAFRLTDFSLIAFSTDGCVSAILPLHGWSPNALADWLSTNVHEVQSPGPTHESIPYDASDRAALSEAARWLNNAADVLDHLGQVGQLDPHTGLFVSATEGYGTVGLQCVAGASGQDPARFPAFVRSGSTPGFLGRADLVQTTASEQASRVEAFLFGLAGSTR